MKTKYIPFFILLVTQLHILRNLTPIYFIFYALSAIISIWYIMRVWCTISAIEKQVIYILLTMFSIPIISSLFGVINGEYDDYNLSIGISRLLFCLPIYLAIFSMPLTKDIIQKLLLVASILTFFAALSYPYQYLFGAISWFADSSFRDGFVRYASLFGSLTTYGIVVGYGLLVTIISRQKKVPKVIVVSTIVVGSIFSLQKAALMNILLGWFSLLYIKNVSHFLTKFLLLVVLLIIPFLSYYILLSNNISYEANGTNLLADILIRISSLPMRAIDFHGITSMILGLGPIGASGAFGYPDVPMAHNGFVTIFLVGGIPFFILFLYFFMKLFFIAYSVKPPKDFEIYNKLGIVILLLLLINMMFSGMFMFAPASAMFFAIAIKSILLSYKKSTYNALNID